MDDAHHRHAMPTVDTSTAPVETASGKVRGCRIGATHRFLGIPYGATTEGRGRFRVASPPVPWADVRPALTFGAVCPQSPRALWQANERVAHEEAFLFGWNDTPQGEDCLRLNVWTPSPGFAAKRPVMVWLHGGHFSMGSGHELAAFDGANLAARGDVVVVTLNHRLNALGFLNLEEFGESFAGSANAGMLDLILALVWVRESIAAFGGDPGRVTIFGQSGGGAKVTTLMGMPAAKGLFHRAIVQSNCALRQMPLDTSLRLTREVMASLGVHTRDAERLREVPYAKLADAERAAIAALCPPPNPARRNRRVRWEPVVDGVRLPEHAFDGMAPEWAADIPLLVGTTLNEFHHGIGNDLPTLMSFADAESALTDAFGESGRDILDLFRGKNPDDTPFDVLSRVFGTTIRQSAVAQAEMMTARRAGSTWLYRFDWRTPVLDARPRAYHNAELPFVFHNVERCATATGGGPDAGRLADVVADAWIAFARDGKPGHAGLPAWPPFTPDGCETMLFDASSRLDAGGDCAERAAVGEA